MNLTKHFDYSPEVLKALKENKPVVALESTLISHGMPYPQNVETATAVEKIVRDNGAVPATVAVIEGRIKIGLTNEEIVFLAQSEDVIKVSRRDLPYIVSQKKNGGTTVASSMILAELAGIKVFVTGGIGGVHREAQITMDISADLEELATTSVAVVTSGPKSILDLGLTIEYLETKGVPVIGYQTSDFPAFFARKSGYKVDYRIEDAKEAAEILDTKWNTLQLKGSVLINNPVPHEFALEEEFIESIINKAMIDAKKQGIVGKAVTPFLLKKVKELTDGKSLKAAIELVKDNARVGALVAKEMQEITNKNLQIN
ncbi:pseudouridine-5'-phosphate glycosidase [Bacillus mycoides]|uniref:pseudouridine-5'-phosphate glycosidase n=1 Tax=Bacillus TaxID=1386 RepID=UPI0019130929|nr:MULTISPECIES: pseudouridine-5'-phosphate glycosidase [Bacillus]MBK5432168.1 pseudouridine-5'-phosphate glycosidase [Bacillus sp. TH25]MCZ6944547.1 pseudouridine-5'-phosphate glycosidase [Bacillus mycoides]